MCVVIVFAAYLCLCVGLLQNTQEDCLTSGTHNESMHI